MAKQLKTLPTTAIVQKTRTPNIPWSTYLDGNKYQLTQGTIDEVIAGTADFQSSMNSFIANARDTATKRGKTLCYAFLPDDPKSVIIWAIDSDTAAEAPKLAAKVRRNRRGK